MRTGKIKAFFKKIIRCFFEEKAEEAFFDRPSGVYGGMRSN